MDSTPLGCRFDWYESTHDELDEGLVASHLAVTLGARIVQGKGRNGYAISYAIVRGDDELARVYGRSARFGEVHIVTTSQSCDEVVPIIRSKWPGHRVSRADIAADFRSDFDVLDAKAVALAKSLGISYRLVTDSAGGATRYLGAPSSEVRVRVYRKSEQLRALHPERASEIPDGIVRAEQQVRPGKRETKERAARMEPMEFWGFSRWSMQLAEQLLGFDAERVPTHFRRPSEWARALHFLGKQYGPMLQRRCEDVGREEAVAELLEALGLSESVTAPF